MFWIITDLEKWCEFLHQPGRIYKEFSEVEKEIRLQTDVLAGTTGLIVDKPIRVTVYSPTVVNLTLVDLPGIVKVYFMICLRQNYKKLKNFSVYLLHIYCLPEGGIIELHFLF